MGRAGAGENRAEYGVTDVRAIIGGVEKIGRGYGVNNADADEAFAGLCGSYCANNSHGCYKRAAIDIIALTLSCATRRRNEHGTVDNGTPVV